MLRVITRYFERLTCYCTFCLYKTQFCLENYVNFFARAYRSFFTKLRISSHSLMIERGRHFHPKIPADQRLCKLCSLDEVEDEFHFMVKCTSYADLRAELLSNISEIYDISNMSDNDIFLLLMGFKDYDTSKLVIKFVKSAFESRVSVDI